MKIQLYNGLKIGEAYKVGELSEEFDITMGQSPAGTSYNETGNGIPFFQGRTDFTFRYPSFRIYTTAAKKYAKQGNVLLSVRAPVGDINVALVDCCIGRGLAAIRHILNYTSYTLHKLKSLESEFAPYNGEGTVFGSINQKDLGKINTIIPSSEKVVEFEKVVKALDDKVYNLHKEITTLTQLRDTLLPKLMSGEIDVMQPILSEQHEPVLS